MLYLPVSNDANGVSASLRQPDVHPVKILSANSFAHGRFTPCELARLAADWIDNRLLLQPTTELGSRIFHNVSRRLIRRERRRSTPASLPLGLLTYGWLKSSESERAAFVDEYQSDIWATFESVTGSQH